MKEVWKTDENKSEIISLFYLILAFGEVIMQWSDPEPHLGLIWEGAAVEQKSPGETKKKKSGIL